MNFHDRTGNGPDFVEQIKLCFHQALGKKYSEAELKTLEFKVTREWDSVSHIKLLASIRDTFSVELSYEEMVKMTSYTKVLEALSLRLQDKK